MPRYRLTIEYDGTPFVGWQQQTNGETVQGSLRVAIKSATGEDVVLQGAGRTDTGVHAKGQIAHFDLSREWVPTRIREALNYYLRPNGSIAVLTCDAVADDFDARYSATARHYTYRILNSRPHPVLEKNRVWHVIRPLDADDMNEACRVLIGHHDFTTFRAKHCQANSSMRTLDSLRVFRASNEVLIEASARSFLHNQVRSMVGSLKLVGEGKWSCQDLADALAACDRTACGSVAPAAGLYLMHVDY